MTTTDFEGSGSYGSGGGSSFTIARQPTPGQYYDVEAISDGDESENEEDEKEERSTRVHLSEMTMPEWQKWVEQKPEWNRITRNVNIEWN